MTKDVYKKPFLSYEEQINLLKSRGLSFKNESRALSLLERISYYRLSNYWHPFLEDKQNKTFKKNTDFDSIFELDPFTQRQIKTNGLTTSKSAANAYIWCCQ
jgi:abortive infection bacteriophage resistance protein